MLLMSTTVLPWLRPAAMPASPNSAASTSGVSGTIVMMMSARSATPRALVHCVALLAAIASGILPEREDEQLVAGLDQVAGHRRAHDAQADETDLEGG